MTLLIDSKAIIDVDCSLNRRRSLRLSLILARRMDIMLQRQYSYIIMRSSSGISNRLALNNGFGSN